MMNTRTEFDFAQHIRRTIESDPNAQKWNYLVVKLNLLRAY